MSRSYQKRKDGKWRIYSNVTNSFITDWITENEVKQFLFNNMQVNFKKDVIEMITLFPSYKSNHDNDKLFVDADKLEKNAEFYKELINAEDRYEKIINDRYENLLKEIGL